MCVIDWTAVGTWVGSLAVIATARIAWAQLQRFNDNERVKNTLKLLDDFHKPFHTQSMDVSVSEAIGNVSQASEADVELLNAPGNPGLNDTRRAIQISGLAISNYYSPIPDLIKRGLVDLDLMSEQLKLVTPRALESARRYTFFRADWRPLEEVVAILNAYSERKRATRIVFLGTFGKLQLAISRLP